jgi:hypothetical protein
MASRVPKVGDRVKLKGREPVGTLRHVGFSPDGKPTEGVYAPTALWCTIDWDEATPGPKICHLREIEKVA